MNNLNLNLWLNETATWAALCCLTLLSYFQFESHPSETHQNLIVFLTLTKFILVYLFFMQMKSSSKFWHALTFIYLFIITIFTWI